jgi:hypothetical protein
LYGLGVLGSIDVLLTKNKGITMQGKTESISKLMKNDSASFKIIFILCFVTFFMGALFALVLPMQWRGWLPGSEGDKSFFESVKVGVYSFMSYLT